MQKNVVHVHWSVESLNEASIMWQPNNIFQTAFGYNLVGHLYMEFYR